MQPKRPILVTGAHRSGTTWVGRMLAADRHTAYLSEPLNVLHRPGVFGAPVSRWYQYICEENESAFLPAFAAMLAYRYRLAAEIRALRSRKDLLRMLRDLSIFFRGRLLGRRALIKDPFAVFSAAWLANRLNCRVVFTVRHPAGFVSSLKRLNWLFDLTDLLHQPLLMRDHLEQDRADMESAPPGDLVGQVALLWRLVYRVVDRLCNSHPEFIAVRQEDLSLEPMRGFQALYESLSLEFSPRVRRMILNSSSPDNPMELSPKNVHSVKLNSQASVQSWKRLLSGDEITRVRRITEQVSHRYYSEADWM